MNGPLKVFLVKKKPKRKTHEFTFLDSWSLAKLIKEKSEFCPEFDIESPRQKEEILVRGMSSYTEPPRPKRRKRKESITSLLFN